MTVFDTNKTLTDMLQDLTPTGTLFAVINATSLDMNDPGDWPHTLTAVGGAGDIIFRDPALGLPIQYDDKGNAANRPQAGEPPMVLTFDLHGDDGVLEGTPETVSLTITGVASGTAPAAFAGGDWDLNDVPSTGGDKLQIDILSLPSDGGSAITAIKYQVNGGAAQTLAGTGTGARTITVPAGAAATVRLWAVNAIGAGDNAAAGASKSQTPTTLSGGEPAAHTTVANAASLNTLLDQLESNYDVTVAANGGTAGADFYIDAAAGSYNAVQWSNRSFAHTVHVRAQDRVGGATLGKTTISASHNLRIGWFEIINAAGSGVTLTIANACSDLTVSHCRIWGHPTAGQKASGSNAHTVDLTAGGGRHSNIRIEYCDIQRAGQNGIRARQTDGLFFVGNVFDELGTDDWQIKDIDGGMAELNWSSTLNRASGAAHMDGGQMTKDSSTVIGARNFTIRRNVVADWRLPDPTNQPYRMGWQCGDYNHVNITIEDNIVLCGNTHGANLQGGPYTVRKNLFWRLNGVVNIHGTTHTAINGSTNGSFVDNFEMIPAGSGTSPRASSINVDNTDAARAAHIGGLRVGGESWLIGGVGGDFSEMYPQASSELHWDHASPKGPYARLKEIFVDGIHPANDGWPTAAAWNAGHNQHGRITS